uniref:Uncharacterized protein n=1 Tax=Sander lucioperca TaxID=283035 RepID=A0A8C9ZJ48_SANLU
IGVTGQTREGGREGGREGTRGSFSLVLETRKAIFSSDGACIRAIVSPDRACIRAIFSSDRACIRAIFSSDGACIRAIVSPDRACIRAIFSSDRACIRAIFSPDRACIRAIFSSDRACIRAIFSPDRARIPAIFSSDRARIRAIFSSDRARIRVIFTCIRVPKKILCLVLPICFVSSWFKCAINITLSEKKIVAENRDINSKLKIVIHIFFPESCRPTQRAGKRVYIYFFSKHSCPDSYHRHEKIKKVKERDNMKKKKGFSLDFKELRVAVGLSWFQICRA